MEEEILRQIWSSQGYEEKGLSFENFSADMEDTKVRNAIWKKAGYEEKGLTFDAFESDLGVGNAAPNTEPIVSDDTQRPTNNRGGAFDSSKIITDSYSQLNDQIQANPKSQESKELTEGFVNKTFDFIGGFIPDFESTPVMSGTFALPKLNRGRKKDAARLATEAREEVYSKIEQPVFATTFEQQYNILAKDESIDSEDLIGKANTRLTEHARNTFELANFKKSQLSDKEREQFDFIMETGAVPEGIEVSDKMKAVANYFDQASKQNKIYQNHLGKYKDATQNIAQIIDSGRDGNLSAEQIQDSVKNYINESSLQDYEKEALSGSVSEIGTNGRTFRALNNAGINLAESVMAVGNWVSGLLSDEPRKSVSDAQTESNVEQATNIFSNIEKQRLTKGKTDTQGRGIEDVLQTSDGKRYAISGGRIIGIRNDDETLTPIQENSIDASVANKFNAGEKIEGSETKTNFRGLSLFEQATSTGADMITMMTPAGYGARLTKAAGGGLKAQQAASTIGLTLGINGTMFGSTYNEFRQSGMSSDEAGAAALSIGTAIGLSERFLGIEGKYTRGILTNETRSVLANEVKKEILETGIVKFIQEKGVNRVVNRVITPIAKEASKDVGRELGQEVIAEQVLEGVITGAFGGEAQFGNFTDNLNLAAVTIAASSPMATLSSTSNINKISDDAMLRQASRNLDLYDEVSSALMAENPGNTQLEKQISDKRVLLEKIAATTDLSNDLSSNLNTESVTYVNSIQDQIVDLEYRRSIARSETKKKALQERIDKLNGTVSTIVAGSELDGLTTEDLQDTPVITHEGNLYSVEEVIEKVEEGDDKISYKLKPLTKKGKTFSITDIKELKQKSSPASQETVVVTPARAVSPEIATNEGNKGSEVATEGETVAATSNKTLDDPSLSRGDTVELDINNNENDNTTNQENTGDTSVVAEQTNPEQTKVKDLLSESGESAVDLNGQRGTLRLNSRGVYEVETDTKIIELGEKGSITEESSLEELGIKTVPKASIDEFGDVSFNDKKYTNPFSKPLEAIEVNDKGERVVTLLNENGENRTFRGQQAEDIAYELTLNEITNKYNEEFQTEIEQQDLNGEIQEVAEKPTTQNNGSVSQEAVDLVDNVTPEPVKSPESTEKASDIQSFVENKNKDRKSKIGYDEKTKKFIKPDGKPYAESGQKKLQKEYEKSKPSSESDSARSKRPDGDSNVDASGKTPKPKPKSKGPTKPNGNSTESESETKKEDKTVKEDLVESFGEEIGNDLASLVSESEAERESKKKCIKK